MSAVAAMYAAGGAPRDFAQASAPQVPGPMSPSGFSVVEHFTVLS
jgi:hypothetical protein